MARFEGKTAVVTGAASGMGKEVAAQLSAEGARVLALDIVFPKPSPSDPQELWSSSSRRTIERYHDVTSPEHWDKLAIDLATGDSPGVDILINAAGVMDYKPLTETEYSDWRRTLGVDLDGVMLGMRALIPLMKPPHRSSSGGGGGGSIVNFSSALATVTMPNSPGYAAAKAAVAHLTRNAAVTYGADNVRVNAVLPGIIDTPMVRSQAAEFNAAAVARTPLGRMGTAWEVARCVLFMASDEAAFMTGSAVTIDGGFSAM